MVFCPYLKEDYPQPAKRRLGDRFSSVQKSELNKHFVAYFNLTQEAKRSLAASLGITTTCLRSWMCRKWEKEKSLEGALHQLQTLYKQQHGINSQGIPVFVTVTQFTQNC